MLKRDDSFVKKTEELCSRYSYNKAKYVMNPFGKYGKKNIFKKEIYGEGQMVPYLDFYVRVPSELDFYLTQYYGNYMSYPPEDEINKALAAKHIVEEL